MSSAFRNSHFEKRLSKKGSSLFWLVCMCVSRKLTEFAFFNCKQKNLRDPYKSEFPFGWKYHQAHKCQLISIELPQNCILLYLLLFISMENKVSQIAIIFMPHLSICNRIASAEIKNKIWFWGREGKED